ncbi:glycosyltransferase family 2 protein [Bifidobacterium thermophilum]|uniref:Glycosyltransferase n=1 Tax=Bifidobacterium thermophilum RBL67 TaxID=1254439 RepID=M4RCU1_9BIFI|nr:glycosyltransferase family 2 protein [Bifidobacterium thermophilum]AGH40338.1 glycosyltransferase [Bifidobacterium thermophilum RBL67]MDW8485805.1 glycosyltransferase family 2 protein [Bifidobacterium thermophilum]
MAEQQTEQRIESNTEPQTGSDSRISASTGTIAPTAPTVSIIVPVYNAAGALRRCIDSILGQEYRDFELIALDDGSHDDSPAILDEYAAKDPRVRVIHKPNSGVSDTRNLGMALARGTYIQFLDADDWITEDATKLLVRAAEHSGADMVIADFYRVVGEGTSRKGGLTGIDRVISREEYADELLKDPADFYFGVLWNKLYRRDIIRGHQVSMDTSVSWCEDFIFNLDYMVHAASVYPVHVPMYYYVKTEGSLVNHAMKLSETVRIKRYVFDYYTEFFRQVYDEDTFARKRANIYRYLIAWASDGSANPALPSTKRLGEERLPLIVPDGMRDNPFIAAHLASRILDRYLERIATQFGMDLGEVRVIVFLHYGGDTADFKALQDYLDAGRVSVTRLAETLALKGYVDSSLTRKGAKLELTAKAEPVERMIDQAAADFERLAMGGLQAGETLIAGIRDAAARGEAETREAVDTARRAADVGNDDVDAALDAAAALGATGAAGAVGAGRDGASDGASDGGAAE